MKRSCMTGLLALLAAPALAADPEGVKIDKDKKAVIVDAKIAPASSPSTTRSTRSRWSPAGPTRRGRRPTRRSSPSTRSRATCTRRWRRSG